MKVIERYIFGRALLLFFASLVWTLAIVWTTQILTRINLVTDSGQSALAFFQIAAMVLPSVIPVVLPFATIIAVAQTLNTMNNDSELVVISAAGASPTIIARPVILLSVLASIASFAIDNGVDPYARQKGRDLVAAARADMLSAVIQEGTFRKIEEGLFIQIGERLPDGRLGGIFVADSRTEGTDLVYYARTGTVVEQKDQTILVMQDGEIQRKVAGKGISTIRFLSYAFDLSMFTAAAGKPRLYPKDMTLPYLLHPDPDDQMYQKSPKVFRAEIHRRFSEWIYPLVFALVAFAVIGNARSHRESRINPVVTAVVIALIVRWSGYVAANQVQVTSRIWPLVYLIPLCTAGISIWFIATNRAMELPVTAAERLTAFMRRIGERMMFMRFRRSGPTSEEAA
ncbi:MAG: LPS export ABC transporter permease LptF [Hyphomicrobiales bacterium]|nr:LPS export ABC transporter permease LptF [Hyphomicrobiales bacterium]